MTLFGRYLFRQVTNAFLVILLTLTLVVWLTLGATGAFAVERVVSVLARTSPAMHWVREG